MSVRPFSFGDIVRYQRMARYPTRLDPEYHLLLSHAPLRAALTAFLPWLLPGITTYALSQKNELAHAGFLQVCVAGNRGEAHALTLLPALDAPDGHPAVWQKLLAHAAQELAQRRILRLFAQVPDQPLPVQTFKQVGFQLYARRTVWRMVHSATTWPVPEDALRPARPEDAWALEQLLRRLTPPPVWLAEYGPAEDERPRHTLWSEAPFGGIHSQIYVLERGQTIQAGLRLDRGPRGVWLHLWIDPLNPDPADAHLVVRYGLALARSQRSRRPIYTGLREDQAGLRSVLTGYGFVPFTDRACMVRPLAQWAGQKARRPLTELVTDVLPGTLPIPQSQGLAPGEVAESHPGAPG